MKNKKASKIVAIVLGTVLLTSALTGCGSDPQNEGGFDTTQEIAVITREDGSGTRGAFSELFKITEKNAEGKTIDLTTPTADITQSTGVVITSVSDNEYALGYISLGSLNDTVKALSIDGAEATTDNIKNGSYKVSRPFNIATKGEVSPQAQDFISYIMSEEGQKIVEEEGYISNENNGAYQGTKPTGKITIAGSSSVTPVMEKLKEAYTAINPEVSIEISQSDSTNGMNSAIDGISDIGMASREVKQSELDKGIKNTIIALDGIAVIVNKNNPTNDMTTDEVKEIYIGNTTTWDMLTK